MKQTVEVGAEGVPEESEHDTDSSAPAGSALVRGWRSQLIFFVTGCIFVFNQQESYWGANDPRSMMNAVSQVSLPSPSPPSDRWRYCLRRLSFCPKTYLRD